MKQAFLKTISLIFPALAVFAAAAALYGYLYWQTSIFTDHALLAEKVNAAQEGTHNQEKNIQAEYAATTDDRARLAGFFVPADNAVIFIEAVEALGPVAGANVTISSIQAATLESNVPGAVGPISAAVDVQGSWNSVMKTLVLAEALPYRTAIDDVSLVETGSPPPAPSVAVPSAAVNNWHLSFQITSSMLAQATSTKS